MSDDEKMRCVLKNGAMTCQLNLLSKGGFVGIYNDIDGSQGHCYIFYYSITEKTRYVFTGALPIVNQSTSSNSSEMSLMILV